MTVPLWNDRPVKIKEPKSLNGFKAWLDGQEPFATNTWGFRLAYDWIISIYIYIPLSTTVTVKGFYSAVFTNAGLNETSQLQYITTTTTTSNFS